VSPAESKCNTHLKRLHEGREGKIKENENNLI